MSRRAHTTTLFAPLAALTLLAQGGHASIVNPSFEETTAHPLTDFVRVPTGWTIDTFLFEDYPSSGATDGWFSLIQPHHGRSMGISFGGRLTQSVFLDAGDELRVDVAVETAQSFAYGEALVELVSPHVTHSQSVLVPWESGFGTWGGTSLIEWQTLSLVVSTPGTYDLRLQGRFGGTADGETWAFFDNIRVVPSPGAAAVLGLAGVLAAGGRRRR